MAAEEAIAESGIGRRGDFPGPLFLAVPPIEIEWPQRVELAQASGANDAVSYDDLLRAAAQRPVQPVSRRASCSARSPTHLAETFGTKGSPISLSTACASGATAIQLGVEAIRRGETDAALCIGTDGSVNPESLIRFSLLSALSTTNDPPARRAKPFAKNRDGFVMAEGAGALVLESLASAKARGAKILGVSKAAARWRTPSTARARARTASRSSAASATRSPTPGLTPDDIDYVNPHGTGTPENDKMECLGVMAVFGERAKTLPISSNKSMIGHTLSAAGAVEAVFTLLTLQHQRIPPTINYQMPDPAIPLDVVPNEARDAKVRHVDLQFVRLRRPERSLVMGRETGVTGHHPRAARWSPTASSNCATCPRRRRRQPARCRSPSRRSRSTTSTSGAFAAWPSPSASCRWWSAPRPPARSPRSAPA